MSGADPLGQLIDCAFIALDPTGVITSWSPGAQRLKGYTSEQAVGRHFSMFYTEQDRADGLPARMLEHARVHGHVEHRGWRVRQDGVRFWGDVVIIALHDAQGQLTGYAKVTRDLTEQHQLEASLHASEARFRALVSEVVEYAIIALDLDGVIQSWNAGAERLKGYTSEQAVGQHFSMFYTEQDQADGLPARMLEQAREHGHVEHQGWRVRSDGASFWGDVVITALHDPQGAVIGYAKVTRDLTGQHRLEVAQASLYAVISHDLKTPITVIRAYAVLMGRADAVSRAGYAAGIEANADQLGRLIDELFDFAKVRAGVVSISLEPLSLSVLARVCAVNLAPTLTNHLVEIGDSTRLVMADRAAMERVLGNLLTNAAKYSPQGSVITIAFENRSDRVRLSVSDLGRGIAAEDLDTIFGEFVRGRLAKDDGGTGLGLASVRTLAGLQGGRAWIDSTLGEGTTVTVELPAA